VIGPGNQLVSDGIWNYTYDADGNMIQEVGVSSGPDDGITWTYSYDDENRLISAVEVQGSTTLTDVVYAYDAFGNRIEENVSGSSVPSQVIRYAYDGSNIWADLDGSGNLVTRRLFLDAVDAVTARISAGGTVAWYLIDRLGSVDALTDSTGAVIDRIDYDGFGNILSETNPSASDRYLWTGREFDRVTGLQYNRTRYYDPTTGRWTTEDPIGFKSGDTNLYRYERDDPTNRKDPDGL
jgi:RHS repeat-associated protein